MIEVNLKLYGVSALPACIFEYDLITKKLKRYTSSSIDLTGGILHAGNSKLYCYSKTGGANGKSAIVEFDITSHTYTVLASFLNSTNEFPLNSLIRISQHKYIGSTSDFYNNKGTLFEFNAQTNTIINKVENLTASISELFLSSNGHVYGINNGCSYGPIFKYNIATEIISFIYLHPSIICGNGITNGANGKLYSTFQSNTSGASGMFTIDTATSLITYKKEFDLHIEGSNPNARILELGQGKFLISNSNDGANGGGTFLEFDAMKDTFTTRVSLGYVDDGNTPVSMSYFSGKFYGLMNGGGIYNKGVIFEYDPYNKTYNKKHDFNGSDGAKPINPFVLAANNKFYGMTPEGGRNNKGVLYEYDPMNDHFRKIFNIDSVSAQSFKGGVLLHVTNNNLYGVLKYGYGALFEYNYSSGKTIIKKEFDSSTGFDPVELIQASNGKLYGINLGGGAYNYGTLYEYDVLSNSFNVLMNFDSYTIYTNRIVEFDNKIYGCYSPLASSKTHVWTFDLVSKNFTNYTNPFGSAIENYGAGSFINTGSKKQIFGFATGDGMIGSTHSGTIFKFDTLNRTMTGIYEFINDFPVSIEAARLPPRLVSQTKSDTVCLNDKGVLWVNYLGSDLQFTWLKNGIPLAGQNNDTLILLNTTISDNGLYSCIVRNNCCSDTSKPIPFVVKNYPTPSITISASSSSVCRGNSLTLTATGADNYYWTNGVTNNQAFIPLVSQSYMVTATNSTGCKKVDSIYIQVKNIPHVEAGSDIHLCNNYPYNVLLNGGGQLQLLFNGWDMDQA